MVPTTPGAVTRSGKKSSALLQDPIGLLLSLLESDITPETCWPSRTEGLQDSLRSSDSQPATGSCVAKRLLAAIGGPSVSTIKVHRTEAALQKAARVSICHFGWLDSPSDAVVVVATPEEQQRWEALIARWWKEEFIPAGKDPAAAPSVVLASTIGRRRWLEVVVAPGCLTLRGLDLANVVAAAALGLHTLPMPRS
jgi:hypothetical protein